jgi:hypothetical protein
MYEDLRGRLVDCQHGFVKGRSTVSNLLEYSSFVLKSIEAFDRVRVIVYFWTKCLVMMSLPAVGGCVLTFLVESSA